MKQIQWFPGHMAKTRRKVTEKINLVDIVFELLDARIPLSSRNPMINEIVGNKPRLILRNKSALADRDETNKWISFYKSQGVEAIAINSIGGNGLKSIIDKSKIVLKDKLEKNK